MELRIAGIIKESVVDGPGLRTVIFTQGCFHKCEGCHNPDTHDPRGGSANTVEEILQLLSITKLIQGVTFSGGEPFLQAEPLAYLAKQVRLRGLNVVTYSGFIFEELLKMAQTNDSIKDLLYNTDLLIDGPYQASNRDLRLAFRGSSNQRLIDVAASLRSGKIILWAPQDIAI